MFLPSWELFYVSMEVITCVPFYVMNMYRIYFQIFFHIALILSVFMLFYIGHKVQSHAVTDTEIGQLSVMDEDINQSHTFSLVSGGEGHFLVSSTGQVTKATAQSLESGRVYDILVDAIDDGQPQLKVCFHSKRI